MFVSNKDKINLAKAVFNNLITTTEHLPKELQDQAILILANNLSTMNLQMMRLTIHSALHN